MCYDCKNLNACGNVDPAYGTSKRILLRLKHSEMLKYHIFIGLVDHHAELFNILFVNDRKLVKFCKENLKLIYNME